jgi:hypothetical protein
MTNNEYAEILQSIKFLLENEQYSDDVEGALDAGIKALHKMDCLVDRPCDTCKHHQSGHCDMWACVFDE